MPCWPNETCVPAPGNAEARKQRPAKILGFNRAHSGHSTLADHISVKNGGAHRFEQPTPETISMVEVVERVAEARVSLIATGFDPRSIIDRGSGSGMDAATWSLGTHFFTTWPRRGAGRAYEGTAC